MTVVTAPVVTAVLVNHRTASHVRPCLESLARAAAGVALEVVVVDAASPDREAARAASAGAAFVALETNRGFGAAANAGAALARAPLLLFVNPDARPEVGAVAALVQRLEALDAAAVVPRLVDERGRHQPGDAGPLPSAAGAWRYAVGGAEGLFVRDARERRVGWGSGAFLLVRAGAFREVQGFDERFFLFGEDVDLGARLAAAGFATWYVPSVRVVHAGGASYRRARGLSPLEGRWVLGLARAHARTGATGFARRSFALALAVGLAARACVHAVAPGGRLPAEARALARRLLAAARVAGTTVVRGPGLG